MRAGSLSVDCSTQGQNRLLAMLPQETRDRMEPNLELVRLPLGRVVHESGDPEHYAYFPTDSVVSLIHVTEDGELAEISAVGNEGIVGITALLGGGATWSRAIVQRAGTAYRLPARLLQNEFDRHGELLQLILRYTQWVLTQVGQTAACNRHHSIEQQVCRWLLLSVSRVSGDELFMTQEMLANILGVRREGVTAVAGKLRDLGLIRYRRGRIQVLDRNKLEQLSCECYAVLKRELDRLLQFHSRSDRSRTSAN